MPGISWLMVCRSCFISIFAKGGPRICQSPLITPSIVETETNSNTDFGLVSPGTRVIAHWPSLPAKLAGKVIGIEHGKYYVEYDDGDKHHNSIDQLRILKPPLYFGKPASILAVRSMSSLDRIAEEKLRIGILSV